MISDQQHKLRAMRSLIYRGFKITIYDNRAATFRYEWKAVPITQQTKCLVGQKILHDPTSDRKLKDALYRAKEMVNYYCRSWQGLRGLYRYDNIVHYYNTLSQTRDPFPGLVVVSSKIVRGATVQDDNQLS